MRRIVGTISDDVLEGSILDNCPFSSSSTSSFRHPKVFVPPRAGRHELAFSTYYVAFPPSLSKLILSREEEKADGRTGWQPEIGILVCQFILRRHLSPGRLIPIYGRRAGEGGREGRGASFSGGNAGTLDPFPPSIRSVSTHYSTACTIRNK